MPAPSGKLEHALNTSPRVVLALAPLTRTAFAPFGDVIETEAAHHYPINEGFAERYHDLARVDVGEQGGRPLISVFRAKPRPTPIAIRMMERHPLSSQAFIPLSAEPFLVVVAQPGPAPRAADLRVFLTNGRQGVNYARGVWHHSLLAINRECDFLVVDRGGPGPDCDEISVDGQEIIVDLRTS
jgi:ureidoglycolate lyase